MSPTNYSPAVLMTFPSLSMLKKGLKPAGFSSRTFSSLWSHYGYRRCRALEPSSEGLRGRLKRWRRERQFFCLENPLLKASPPTKETKRHPAPGCCSQKLSPKEMVFVCFGHLHVPLPTVPGASVGVLWRSQHHPNTRIVDLGPGTTFFMIFFDGCLQMTTAAFARFWRLQVFDFHATTGRLQCTRKVAPFFSKEKEKRFMDGIVGPACWKNNI